MIARPGQQGFQFSAPFVPSSPTSRAAAASLTASKAATERERVYRWIWSCGERGSTDEEGQDGTGLAGSSYRPRRVELWRANRIKETGTRATRSGRSAVTWTVTAARAAEGEGL